jgi:hypothetical protein
MAPIMDAARGSQRTSRTKLPSIFSMLTGGCRRHESEENPVPQSSSATGHVARALGFAATLAAARIARRGNNSLSTAKS